MPVSKALFLPTLFILGVFASSREFLFLRYG
jgi:hypothetical protein